MDLPVDYTKLTGYMRRKVREEYVRVQEGKCHYCGCPLDGPMLFPFEFFKWPVHLHHHHDTGMTIGAVHAYCNAVLWEYDGE